ncbi:MAG: HNH endonuclease [Parcubacteria group bacterium]
MNPKLWDKNSPLVPPEWFNDEMKIFIDAVRIAARGNRTKSIQLLSKIKSDELRDWYCEHGQMSGMFRNNELKIETVKNNISLDPLRSPDKYRKEVFQRDNYTCQYCGTKVIPKEVFAAYSKFVGMDFFRAAGTNSERHGVVLAFRANADHVVPWIHGGRTSPENLITSCWSCNYGKSGYTLEEIGISDPREKKLTNLKWQGLSEYILKLEK